VTVVSFEHQALLYDDDHGYVTAIVPFLRHGLAGGEAVLCAVPVDRIWLLRDALGSEADQVTWTDMAELGRNPALIIPAWQAFLERARLAGRRCRGVGEPVWPARGADELLECQRHETLLNLVFGGGPSWPLLCPYDRAHLPPEVIDEAHRSHPVVAVSDERLRSSTYGATDTLGGPVPAVVERAATMAFAADDLHALRAFVTRHGAPAGLDGRRLADLVLATNEVATNTIRHGGGLGTLRVWVDGDRACCEVRDTGRLTDPLVGRRLPTTPFESGRGLWMANHLCDLVQLWSGAGGTVVRLHQSR
jgi:anti-sigma regulatory factor (Ser/Thr protein kinase)